MQDYLFGVKFIAFPAEIEEQVIADLRSWPNEHSIFGAPKTSCSVPVRAASSVLRDQYLARKYCPRSEILRPVLMFTDVMMRSLMKSRSAFRSKHFALILTSGRCAVRWIANGTISRSVISPLRSAYEILNNNESVTGRFIASSQVLYLGLSGPLSTDQVRASNSIFTPTSGSFSDGWGGIPRLRRLNPIAAAAAAISANTTHRISIACPSR